MVGETKGIKKRFLDAGLDFFQVNPGSKADLQVSQRILPQMPLDETSKGLSYFKESGARGGT